MSSDYVTAIRIVHSFVYGTFFILVVSRTFARFFSCSIWFIASSAMHLRTNHYRIALLLSPVIYLMLLYFALIIRFKHLQFWQSTHRICASRCILGNCILSFCILFVSPHMVLWSSSYRTSWLSTSGISLCFVSTAIRFVSARSCSHLIPELGITAHIELLSDNQFHASWTTFRVE